MDTTHPLYRRLLWAQIRYAALMSILSLVAGLFYREFSRPFFKGLTLEDQLLYGHALELVHGHTFLLGVAIPATLALLTFLVVGQLAEKDLARMQVRFRWYTISSAVALVLMLYKGIGFVVGAGQSLDVIDERLFFGSTMLRATLFAASHMTLAWAFGEYAFRFFRATKQDR